MGFKAFLKTVFSEVTIGKVVSAAPGFISLGILIWDKFRKGARLKSVLESTEYDGQTQRQSIGTGPMQTVHWCIFQFRMRLDNSGNEDCTLTDVKIESCYEHDEEPILQIQGDGECLRISPKTSGYFACESRVRHVGSLPISPTKIFVTMNFVGHKPIKMPITFTFPEGKYREIN